MSEYLDDGTRTLTKVFINDYDTQIGNALYFKDTLTGYVRTYIKHPHSGVEAVEQYRITTARPKVEVLGDWDHAYLGFLRSFKKYYKNNFKNAKVSSGNIIIDRDGLKGPKAIACWMAAYDKKVLTFQIHFATGRVFQTTDVCIGVNTNDQRETEFLSCIEKGEKDSYVELATRQIQRRKGGKLTQEQEAEIRQLIRDKEKLKDIAARYGVTQPYISKLKKQFLEDGLLSIKG